MARAVLEREGYGMTTDDECEGALSVEVHEFGWRVSAESHEWNGHDFASLAAFLRRRSTRT
jgi:hypothetical protein